MAQFTKTTKIRKMRNIHGLGDVNLQIENFTWPCASQI